MIQTQTYLNVADNKGVRKLMCIRVLGNRRAKLGEIIIAVVKEVLPNISIQRSEIVRAVVVRKCMEMYRKNGSSIRFGENAAVIINKDGNPRGSRVFGPIARELRDKNFAKIISLAPEEQVVCQLYEQFKYKNIHQIPRLKKIVINRGLSSSTQNVNVFETSLLELTTIATQHGVITRARKAIASFKIREKIPVGLIVTLRGERIYAFLDRLINLALPRIRDFQGVSLHRFDGIGNYSLGLYEQLMFPEIRYDQINQLQGIGLSIVMTSQIEKESLALLKRLGMPFKI